MTISDLVQKCTYESVEAKLKLHYAPLDAELERYRTLYHRLSDQSESSTEAEDFFIFITALREGEEEDTRVSCFEEDDTSLYFDVSGCESDDETVYSIAASGYPEFLQYRITTDTLRRFSAETILAHCLYEVTAYGFEK